MHVKHIALPLAALAFCAASFAQPVAPVQTLAASEQPKLLETLKTLVEIETGSTNRAGLDKASTFIAERLKALGAEVVFMEPTAADTYRMEDTPEKPEAIGRTVRASFKGTGTKKILLIAHMDTVYPAGMLAQQPWRIDGNKAYGLGISDDKQGVAVILHTVAMLKALNVRDYGTLTVMVNGDEEISSPAARKWLSQAGAEHDAVMSFEASRTESDKIALATSGIALATLSVKGRASHAGGAPEHGVNALYELSHQLLQLRDLSVPARGLKMNWTMSRAGVVRNMIPPGAQAWADIRLLKVADLAGLEKQIAERIKTKLLPESEVTVTIENRRPPLEATAASRALAVHAQRIYKELAMNLVVDPEPEGGGTDAAFAALQTKAPVIERFGLRGFGAHSTNAEYVLIDSIQPRLYLATRMVMEIASGKAL
ncbi:glutamate carboxypeptidase [uncultured Ramlibacter sp.]|uniref:glutamate carboxypeptidase n=1 Tax=uncultured Ramlibacter sp. TaxID=260755 RepID=UPI002629BEEA|nr:glutamate carboxypeptidase [uncultured Ramlibacter sp.]